MRTTTGRRPAALVALALLFVLAPVPTIVFGRGTEAGPPETARITEFHADVRLRRGVVAASSARLDASAPAVTYHIERRLARGRWRSILTVASPVRPPFVSPAGKDEPLPPVITRLEDDGDGSGVRMYGRDGRAVDVAGEQARVRQAVGHPMPDPADAIVPPVSTAESDWIESLRPSAAGRAARRVALRQRFGAGSSLGPLDRFVVFRDGETTEILADREWGVPVEINVLEGGVLERHTAITYTAAAGGLLRTGFRSEQRLEGGGQRRAIVELELANVRFGEGR